MPPQPDIMLGLTHSGGSRRGFTWFLTLDHAVGYDMVTSPTSCTLEVFFIHI